MVMAFIEANLRVLDPMRGSAQSDKAGGLGQPSVIRYFRFLPLIKFSWRVLKALT